MEHNGACSIKLKHKALRGQSVLATIFTPQIPYRFDDGDVNGKTGDMARKYCREWSALEHC